MTRWRLRDAAICVLFAALCLNSSSGRLTPDTKMDLIIDPGSFLARGLRLWDPQGFAGQVGDQAYGYLFPMGPFFQITHAIGLPGWVAQRLWWTLLLSVAFLGVVRLADALRLGTPVSRRMAGCAYACSPHVLTLLGANSIESLPMCVAPWVVLALVRGAAGGSPRRAGLACGVAVLCMGGVNAAADLAAILPAVLWLLTRQRSRRLAALAAWAVVGSVLATFWWVVPLLLLGRYSPPFLNYIENANTTTSVTSLSEALRGTADWVAYLPANGWHAGYQLLTEPVLIIDSMLVAAVGLAGLAATRSVHRTWLIACLGIGVVALTFGHAATVGPLFAHGERGMLDTVLAPVRNVHKFDVLIRLPLILGLADLLPRVRWGRTTKDRRQAKMIVRVLAVVAVIGTAAPMVTLNLANDASFTAYPQYWRQTATWLERNSDDGRALLAPASPTPDYIWGTPTDEPLQALAGSPWEVRNNIPLTSPGHIRVLDTVDNLLATGVAQPELATYLARAGVRFLVVRNDLDYRAVQPVAPGVVLATLTSSPGVQRVATFGPLIGGTGDYSYSVDQGLQPAAHAVEIWRVDATGDPRVTTAAASSLIQVSGGPESLLQLQQAGAGLGVRVATVLSGSPSGGLRPGAVALTDGLRRREVAYGGQSGQHSDTLPATDDGLIGRRVMDYLPVSGVTHQSVVRYLGAQSVTASSSAADADDFAAVVPGAQAYSAFDGDGTTSWRTAAGTAPVGQWVQARFTQPAHLSRVTVRVPATVTRVTLTTTTSAHTYAVGAGGIVRAQLGRVSSNLVRATVAGVTGPDVGQTGITDIAIAGVHIERTIVAPTDLPAGRQVDVISFATPGDARTGCLLVDNAPQCVAGRARGSEDGDGLDRTFTLPRGASYSATVDVSPRAGSALTALLDRNAGYTVTALASSQAVPDPLAGAQSVIDGDPTTGWVADASDPDPTVTLRFPRKITLTTLKFVTTPTLAATRPSAVTISSPSGSRRAAIAANGTARFAALTTDEVSLHLGSGALPRPLVASSIAGQTRLGVGVSEIVVPDLTLKTRAATASRRISLPCGSGPTVVLDGRRLQTSIATTMGAVRDLQTVPATLCDTSPVTLAAGTHHLVVGGTALWAAESTTLTRRGYTASSTATAPARVTSWGSTERKVAVEARTTATLLIVNENVNTGWQARLNGTALRTVTIDGWRQGYVLPAGAAGTVQLLFTPQRTYTAALVIGLSAVLLLLVLVLLPRRRRRAFEPATGAAALRSASIVFGVAVCALIGGVVGAGIGVITAAVLFGARRAGGTQGWVALLAPGLAGSALIAAGVLLAVRHAGLADYAANTNALQSLCIVALAAACTVPRTGASTAAPADSEGKTPA